MIGLAIHIKNPFDYRKDFTSKEIFDRTTVREQARVFAGADDFARPTICVFNGQPILRDEWGAIISDGDAVIFITLPQGGDTAKKVGRTVLSIALIAVALTVAPHVAPFLGITGKTAIAFTTAFASAAILAGGYFLINAMLPPPKSPTPDIQNSLAAPSPTYTLSAQGNYARLGQAIPVIYGRHKIYPDFATTPYSIYDDNVQTLYQTFVVGQGENAIRTVDGTKQIFIEDTPISNYGNYESGDETKKIVDYRLLQPGESAPNDFEFERNVIPSIEVTGVELPGPDNVEDWTPWYVITPVNTLADYISVDISLPSGLYKIPPNGKIEAHTVSYQFQARRIDNNGADIDDEFDVATGSINRLETSAYRLTIKTRVPVGRYKMRGRRTDSAGGGNTTYVRNFWWIGAKSHLFRDTTDYGDLTILLVKMAAVGGLTTQNSRKVNLVVERKIKTWSSTSGWTTDPVATRSIAWAFVDACKSYYGGELSDSQIDLESIEALDTIWTNRGDTFNGVVDRRQSLWEILTAIARCGRAIPLIRAGVVTMVRDQKRSLVSGMFSMRNIIPKSLKINYVIANDQVADALSLEYFDADTWRPDTLSVQIADEDGDVDPDPNLTAEVKMFGCTSRAQAWREGIYLLRSNIYRRKTITFDTELEGYIPTYGSNIRISHDMPAWGISGDITDHSDSTATYTTSVPLTFEAGEDHYVAFRKRDGSLTDPYRVTQSSGGDDNVFVLDSSADNPPDFEPDTGLDRERTHFCFGPNHKWSVLARVVAIEPRDGLKVQIKCVEEDDKLHDDEGDPPEDTENVVRTIRIAADEVDVDLHDKFEDAGYNMEEGPAIYEVIIESGVKISSSGESTDDHLRRVPALIISRFASGSEVYLTNRGQIMGGGGGGGVGGGWTDGTHSAAGDGSNGGDAIETDTPLYIDNRDGEIFAGGGGGGGGGATTGLLAETETVPSLFFSGGGGGGGAGNIGGNFGDRGEKYPFAGSAYAGHGDEGTSPTDGDCDGGTGGAGYDQVSPTPTQKAGTGGTGGDCGEPGSDGGTGTMHFPVTLSPGGAGGQAGYAVLATGDATVTWLAGKTADTVKGRE